MGCLVSAFWTNALRWATNSLTPSSSASTEASSAHINHLVCLTKDIVTFDHLNVRSIPRKVKKTLITARAKVEEVVYLVKKLGNYLPFQPKLDGKI